MPLAPLVVDRKLTPPPLPTLSIDTSLAALFRNYVAALPLPPGGTASGDALRIVIGNELNICVEWNSYMAPCVAPPIASGSQWSAEVAAFSRDVLRALRPLPGLLLGVGPLAPSGPGGCPCSGGGGGAPVELLPHPLRAPPALPAPVVGPAYPPAGCAGAGVPYPANFSGTSASFLQYMVACEPALFVGVDFFASHPYPGCNEAPSTPCALAGLTGYVAERDAALPSWRLNPAHSGVVPELPVFVTETAWWGGNETAKAQFMVDALRGVWGADANVSGVTPFLLAGGHWDVDGFTWTRWSGNTLTYLEPIYLGVQALARNGSAGGGPLTQYYSEYKQSHYLSEGCQGCGAGEYAPVRLEGYALATPCPPSATPCVELVTYFNKATGANLVVPSGWGPIPGGFSLWGGNTAYVLAADYSGPLATSPLELWVGHASAGGAPTDYYTLASAASRAEATTNNYTKLALIGQLLNS